jgi:hypothetical protein
MAAVLWLLVLLLAVSACTGPPSGRYVGRSPDRCPYVTAEQVAKIIGQDVTRVSALQDWYTVGGSGCFYDLGVSEGLTEPIRQDVEFEYFPGIGRAGFESWAVDGVPVSGLGIAAAWIPVRLTVLTRRNDVVVITLSTTTGGLAQARQIYRLAAPHLLPAVAANWTGGPALGSDAAICKIYLAYINYQDLSMQPVIKAALRRAGRSITPALARDMVIGVTPHSLDTLSSAENRVSNGCDEVAHGQVPDQ